METSPNLPSVPPMQTQVSKKAEGIRSKRPRSAGTLMPSGNALPSSRSDGLTVAVRLQPTDMATHGVARRGATPDRLPLGAKTRPARRRKDVAAQNVPREDRWVDGA